MSTENKETSHYAGLSQEEHGENLNNSELEAVTGGFAAPSSPPVKLALARTVSSPAIMAKGPDGARRDKPFIKDATASYMQGTLK